MQTTVYPVELKETLIIYQLNDIWLLSVDNGIDAGVGLVTMLSNYFLLRRWLPSTNKQVFSNSMFHSLYDKDPCSRKEHLLCLIDSSITPKDEAEKATFNCSTHNDGDHIMGATKLVHDDIKLNVYSAL